LSKLPIKLALIKYYHNMAAKQCGGHQSKGHSAAKPIIRLSIHPDPGHPICNHPIAQAYRKNNNNFPIKRPKI